MEDKRLFQAVFRFLPFLEPTERELEFLSSMPGRDVEVSTHATIERANGKDTVHLLLDGWAAGATRNANGDRRIHSVYLPGDLVGMAEMIVAEPMSWDFALEDCLLREFSSDQIWSFFEEQPRLAAALLFMAQEDRVSRVEWLSLGSSVGAEKRLAAFLYRLGERINKYRDLGGMECVLPLTQKEVAEIVGITAVYASRLFHKFVKTGLITTGPGGISITKLDALKGIAGIAPWKVRSPSWLPTD